MRPGGLSPSQTAAWAAMPGFARINGPAAKHRLDTAADGFEASDGACIRERGSKTAGWRMRAAQLMILADDR